MHENSSNSDVIKRLKRAYGHLAAVVTMLENEQECVAVAQQLHAVNQAILNAKQTLIRNHIEECLEKPKNDKGTSSKTMRTLKEITKYL